MLYDIYLSIVKINLQFWTPNKVSCCKPKLFDVFGGRLTGLQLSILKSALWGHGTFMHTVKFMTDLIRNIDL